MRSWSEYGEKKEKASNLSLQQYEADRALDPARRDYRRCRKLVPDHPALTPSRQKAVPHAGPHSKAACARKM
jgi:hypothetical protein